jgi:penicillin amidase
MPDFATAPLTESTLTSLEKFSSEFASMYAFLPHGDGLGSNAWVVDGTLTDTGKPFLANDPHLPNRQPATWYEVHLNAPGWNVIGASLPGVPGVIIGHNDHVAWGITNGYLAVQDLFIEQANPEVVYEYRFQDAWELAQVVTELIEVKGFDEPIAHEVVITRHGPIINEMIESADPIALGWTFTEPTDLMGGLLMQNQATDWDSFRQGLSAIPFDLNFVYADVEGNIGYQMTGFLPKRPNGYTGLPIPGWTGEGEWEGIFSQDETPHTLNPSSHFIATANHRPFGPELDATIAGDWAAPFRAERITEMLEAKDTFTLNDMRDIQADAYVASYVRLLNLLSTHQLTVGLEMLNNWDGIVREDDVAPVLLDTVMREAVRLAFQQRLGDTPNFVGYQRGVYWLLDIGESDPNSWWFDNPDTANVESLEDLLISALDAAIQKLNDEAGDVKHWTWAKQRAVTFSHPLGSLPIVGGLFSPTTPTVGGRLTVNRDNTSYRILVDLDDLNGSMSSLTTGQSGHPFSPHYADQLQNWRMVEHEAMLWTRNEIEVEKKAVLKLRPQ